MQSLALSLAVLAKSLDFTPTGPWAALAGGLARTRPTVDGVCFFFFLYTLCSLIATGIAIFDVAYWFDRSQANTEAPRPWDDRPS